MGIVGLGRIGKAIATRVSAFGLEVVYHGRNPQAEVAYRYFPSLVDMAKACDILIVVAPGGPATRHIINAEVLEALGPDEVFVNIARGSLVDEKALIEALRTGKILAAGLDVFENEPNVPEELIALDNVVLLPHVGSASTKTRRAMADCVVANIFAWADGKPPLTPVPETPWRGQWGENGPSETPAREAPASGRQEKAADSASLIGGILAVMRSCCGICPPTATTVNCSLTRRRWSIGSRPATAGRRFAPISPAFRRTTSRCRNPTPIKRSSIARSLWSKIKAAERRALIVGRAYVAQPPFPAKGRPIGRRLSTSYGGRARRRGR